MNLAKLGRAMGKVNGSYMVLLRAAPVCRSLVAEFGSERASDGKLFEDFYGQSVDNLSLL